MLLYRLLYVIFSPLFLVYFLLKSVRNGEFVRFFERLGFRSIDYSGKNCIWIHAVSLGEANSVIGFAKYLKQKNNDLDVLITTGTSSGAKVVIENGFLHQYMPMDFSFSINKFLKNWNPKMAIFVDSEIWPNTVVKLKEKDIPSILLNARLSKKSLQNWMHFKDFFTSILKQYTLILPQSHTEYENFSSFVNENVIEINNLKYSIPPKHYNYKHPNKPTFIAASTHAGEEELIISAYREIVKKYPNLLMILAPRHPERLPEIVKLLEGLQYSIRTEQKEISDDTQVYVVNTFGELDLFYSISDIAFVGGSLVDVGGHNIFEPAIQKCAVIHGSYMGNFFDMSQYFSAVMYEVSSGEDLGSVLESLLADANTMEYIKNQTYSMSQELNKNVIGSAYKIIKDHVKNSEILV